MTNGIDYGRRPPGYRLPDATRLGPVRLQIADLERSLAYYRDVLGLALLERDGDTARLGVQEGGNVLVELVGRPGATPVPDRGRLGLYHFAILLPSRAQLARFAIHLGQLGEQVGAADHSVSEAFYLQDPDGLGIEVYADRPREMWRSSDDQLQMDTRPLNIRDLLAQAGEEPWQGMPPGTVIGHVHLHVGEIAEAENFYHRGMGFDAVVWGYPGALFLSAGGYHHHLGVNTWAGRAPVAGPSDSKLIDWLVQLPSEDEARSVAASLQGAGYPTEESNGVWYAKDPWGTGVRITAVDES